MEICSLNGQCGGCLYQGVAYEEQVFLKGEEVKEISYRRKENEDRAVCGHRRKSGDLPLPQ